MNCGFVKINMVQKMILSFYFHTTKKKKKLKYKKKNWKVTHELWHNHVVDWTSTRYWVRIGCIQIGLLQCFIDIATEEWQILTESEINQTQTMSQTQSAKMFAKNDFDLLITIFHWQIAFNVFHQIVKPMCYRLLLVEWLRSNYIFFHRSAKGRFGNKWVRFQQRKRFGNVE